MVGSLAGDLADGLDGVVGAVPVLRRQVHARARRGEAKGRLLEQRLEAGLVVGHVQDDRGRFRPVPGAACRC